MLLSVGDLIAIGIALLANGVTILVTYKDGKARDASERRAEEWRRKAAERDRIHGHFAGVTLAAGVLEAMTGPQSTTTPAMDLIEGSVEPECLLPCCASYEI